MKIYLLDRNRNMVCAWEKYFSDLANVEIVHDEFGRFMENYDVECIVSPANSYGLMDGGFDYAITKYAGRKLQENVQKYIIENYFGEQIPGTAFIIDIPNSSSSMKLIHCPTMRVPSIIKDVTIVYQCMRSCLMTAKKNNVKSIVIPAFGGACGRVDSDTIASLMRKAYDQVNNPPQMLNWDYANSHHL